MAIDWTIKPFAFNPVGSFMQGYLVPFEAMRAKTEAEKSKMQTGILQEELEKRQAVKTAMSSMGPGGSPTEAVSKLWTVDPEMAVKVQTAVRQANKDQIESLKAAAELTEKMAPSLYNNPQGYVAYANMIGNLGLKSTLPDVTHFANQDGSFNMDAYNEHIKNTVALKDIVKQQLEPPKTREIKVGDKILTQEFNKSTGQWSVIGEGPRWDDKNQLQMQTNPDGTQTIIVGGKPGQLGVGNPQPVQTDIFKKLMGHKEDSAKLSDIIKNYNPQYQTYGGKAWNSLLSFYDKIDPSNVSQEQDKYLQAFAEHKADTYKMMNQMLNRLSGAAVTEHEMKRLTQQLPNAGTGLFDGDNPKAFEAKLKSFKRDNDLAIARYTQWAKEGVIPQDKKQLESLAQKTSLDDMEKILRTRASVIKQELQRVNPNMPEDQINSQTSQRLRQEYNLQ
jgi:hypothetical protein